MNIIKVSAVVVGLIVLLGLGIFVGSLVAGGGSGSETAEPAETTLGDAASPSSDQSGTPDTGSTAGGNPGSAACDLTPGDPLMDDGPSNALMEIGEQDGVRVEAAVYPRPDYEGNPWSQWGQGLILDDGRFLSAIGDHIGIDGNSFIFEYDPTTNAISMIADVLSYTDHEPGEFGYGKVHGQMVEGPCGEAYFATYWGTRRELQYGGSYLGDLLFRIDPASRTISNLGAPVAEHGVPSLAGSADTGLVFGEALDPLVEDDVDGGPFFAYDATTGEVVYEGDSGPHVGYRNIMVDAQGRAFYSIGGGQLAVYDPATNDVATHDSSLPGEMLRASTTPTSDGRIFGVTDDENALFVMEPSGEIKSLGTARDYTASMAVHPDGDRFFYIPDAHGGSWERGTPLIMVDGDSGDQSVVVELNEMAVEGLGLRLGGTYGLAVHPSGDRLYIGMNASPSDDDSGFGEVVLLVVHLP